MTENAPGPIEDPNAVQLGTGEYAEDAVELPEPTGDDVPDGTQIPTDEDLPAEEGDAGVGDVELDEDDEDPPLAELPD